MLASIFILILFLPAAFLPAALEMFSSNTELEDIGICLDSTDANFPLQGYELVGFLPSSNRCDTLEISEPLQTCH